MNKLISDSAVQEYIREQLNADVLKIAMAKSPFPGITGKELANQIAARKKSVRKLPSWFNTEGIYYPPLLSIEQCSSESTAFYKSSLIDGTTLIDLTGGFGVDSHYFSKQNESVIHFELNAELSAIAAFNAPLLEAKNISFIAGDGIDFIRSTDQHFGTIYIDPARRSSSGKVFMLKDCNPDVVSNLEMLLAKSDRLLIKTAPLLDISAGLKELNHVAEIHIVSVKNECKELIWVLKKNHDQPIQIICTTLNGTQKQFIFSLGDERPNSFMGSQILGAYLYEPDVALLKSGAFNLIAERYNLKKLHPQTQLYTSDQIDPFFPGRIFQVDEVLSAKTLKREKDLEGSVIVRNYPDKAATLVNKYRIKPHDSQFIIFTENLTQGKLVIKCTIIQHY